jgi:hypothetical protein
MDKKEEAKTLLETLRALPVDIATRDKEETIDKVVVARTINELMAFYAEITEGRYITEREQSLIDALDGNDTPDHIAVLMADAGVGQTYRDDLIKATVEQRVRAQGDAFESKGYTEMLEQSSIEFIKSELKAYGGEAKDVLVPGRQIEPETKGEVTKDDKRLKENQGEKTRRETSDQLSKPDDDNIFKKEGEK